MLILAHNFKFNIRHHLVVVDGTAGGGRILCDNTVFAVQHSSTKKHANIVEISCKLNDTVFMMKIW